MSRKFTRDERVAIGELFNAAAVCATSANEAVRTLGAVMAERAAGIWRGEIQPYVATHADLREFAKAWDAKTRADVQSKEKTAALMVKDAWIHSSDRLAARWCPSCRCLLDAWTSVTVGGDDEPNTPVMRPGDVTICGYCSAVLVMTTVNFRLATQAEVDALPDLAKRLAREWPTVRRDAP